MQLSFCTTEIVLERRQSNKTHCHKPLNGNFNQ